MQGLVKLLTIVALFVVVEALIIAVCIGIFDMDQAATYPVVIGVLLIVLAIAAYFQNDSNRTTSEIPQRKSVRKRKNTVNQDNLGNKGAAGCFTLFAIIFFAAAIVTNTKEHKIRRENQGITYPSVNTLSTDDVYNKTENIVMPKTESIITTASKANDDDEDPLENPDFDDLVPGDEFDEEFVDGSTLDPELYDDP